MKESVKKLFPMLEPGSRPCRGLGRATQIVTILKGGVPQESIRLCARCAAALVEASQHGGPASVRVLVRPIEPEAA